MIKLMGASFEPVHKCHMRYLTWKVAFLMASTSLRRVSEIQAFSEQKPYIRFYKYKVVLRTIQRLFPRVVTDYYINQSVALPASAP